ncbi:hypothetical protein BKCO1_5600032 [Neofusicoccum parvum]|nr:hypothetical protein BKCO1_5600032 [Neofusicoccum parvum]
MSATINEDAVRSVSNQEGQIGSHVPPSEPLQKGGHKPGVLASEADKAGEFHIQTLPAGSAPASATHAPNNASSSSATPSSAADTLVGSTSSDVHTGLGHPGSGQTSAELRHDGGRSVNHRDPGKVEAAVGGQRGDAPPAEERLPVGAGELASEAPKDRSTTGVGSEYTGGR